MKLPKLLQMIDRNTQEYKIIITLIILFSALISLVAFQAATDVLVAAFAKDFISSRDFEYGFY